MGCCCAFYPASTCWSSCQKLIKDMRVLWILRWNVSRYQLRGDEEKENLHFLWLRKTEYSPLQSNTQFGWSSSVILRESKFSWRKRSRSIQKARKMDKTLVKVKICGMRSMVGKMENQEMFDPIIIIVESSIIDFAWFVLKSKKWKARLLGLWINE